MNDNYPLQLSYWDRRKALLGIGLGASAFLTPGLFADVLTNSTPRQTEGPFYPDEMPLDTDNDLLVIGDSITPAVGEVSHLSGTVKNVKGELVKNALVEIWQVGAKGVYLHTKDDRPGRDENFQGYGRFLTDSKGRYYFRTVKPVTYPGRAPHIHVAVTLNNKRMLTSQCYVKGDKRNDKDFIYKRLSKVGQKLTTVDFAPIKESKANELNAVWDIIIGVTPEG
ncbi:MAG: intradiol ring-cleavage dioxygenase [Verrucomicrobia bacterium]|nr:MAG: intradiol ring-cleavage dioxygenase [Verrucomicrobiota bacterium]